MTAYLWLKAFHAAMVLAWVGGLVLLGVATVSVRLGAGAVVLPHEKGLVHAILRWDRRVTVPAMFLAWALGLALVSRGGWFGAPWLSAKLLLVVGLSGLHGVLAASLRRRVDQPGEALPRWLRFAPLLAVAGPGLVAVLVIVKP
ncbi:MAG: CopD family protein [Rhizobacter sp.]